MESIKVNNGIANINTKRYDFLDVAKGIGILFVVIAHINYTPSVLTVIYSFHMPLFFFLSGMLFDCRKYPKFSMFVKRKTQTLLCPYVLFYVCSFLYRLCVQLVANGRNIDLEVFVSYFSQLFLSQGSSKLPNAPLWFVPCLMIVEVIFYWISKLKRPLVIGVSALVTALGWLIESEVFPYENKLLPWSLDSAFFAIGFFALGNISLNGICGFSQKIRNSKTKSLICITIVLFATALLIPLALYNGKVSMGSKILGNGFILYLTGVLGACIILALSMMLKTNRFLIYCGRNSFIIMAVHYLIRDFLRLLYSFFNIPLYDKYSVVETILPIIIVTALSLLFSLFYNKLKMVVKKTRDVRVTN